MPNKGFRELQSDSASNQGWAQEFHGLSRRLAAQGHCSSTPFYRGWKGARTRRVRAVTQRRAEPTLDLPIPRDDISYLPLEIFRLVKYPSVPFQRLSAVVDGSLGLCSPELEVSWLAQGDPLCVRRDGTEENSGDEEQHLHASPQPSLSFARRPRWRRQLTCLLTVAGTCLQPLQQ